MSSLFGEETNTNSPPTGEANGTDEKVNCIFFFFIFSSSDY
jgi:hypothetical protein